MKRTLSLLAAMLILAMALVPLGALAEPTSTLVLQFSNLVLAADGTTVSMESPTLQLALAESSDGSVDQLIVDLLGKDRTITSAMLQANENSLLFKLGGMDNAYALDMQQLLSLLAESIGNGSDLANWALPQQLMELMTTGWQEDFQAGEPTVSENENGVSMTYTTYTGNIYPSIRKLFQLLRDDAVVNALFQSSDDTEFATLMDQCIAFIDEGNATSDCTITLGSNESGSLRDIDATATYTLKDPENPQLNQTATMNIQEDLDFTDPNHSTLLYRMEMTDEDLSMNYSLEGTFSGLDADSQTLDLKGSFSCDMEGDTSAGEFTLTYADGKLEVTLTGDNDVPTLSITGEFREGHGQVRLQITDPLSSSTEPEIAEFSYDKTESADGLRYEAALRYADGYSEDATLRIWLNLGADGGFEAGLVTEDALLPEENSTISLAYVPGETAEGDLFNGVLSLAVEDTTGIATVSVDVRGFVTAFDTDSLYIDPANAVNVLTMTEDDTLQMNQQLEAVLGNVLQKLGEDYPMLFGSMTGY